MIDPNADTVLSFHQVSKSFVQADRKIDVLREVSLSLARGELVVG